MPELDYALLADFVRSEGGLAHVIGASVDTIHVKEVPTGLNFGLLARITFASTECGRPHRLELIFQDMDGKQIFNLTGVVEPTSIEGLPVGWDTGFLWAMNFGVPIPALGQYVFHLLINDSLKKRLPIRVLTLPTG